MVIHYGNGDEATLVQKFLRGLKPEIGSRLQAVIFESRFELVEKAVNMEEVVEAERRTLPTLDSNHKSRVDQPRRNNQRGNRGRGRFGQFRQSEKVTAVQKKCFICRQVGHLTRDCPDGGSGKSDRKASVTCFDCGEKGHYANECSVRRPEQGGGTSIVPNRPD